MATALAKSKRTPLQFRYIYDRITVSRRINQGESIVGSGVVSALISYGEYESERAVNLSTDEWNQINIHIYLS